MKVFPLEKKQMSLHPKHVAFQFGVWWLLLVYTLASVVCRMDNSLIVESCSKSRNNPLVFVLRN